MCFFTFLAGEARRLTQIDDSREKRSSMATFGLGPLLLGLRRPLLPFPDAFSLSGPEETKEHSQLFGRILEDEEEESNSGARYIIQRLHQFKNDKEICRSDLMQRNTNKVTYLEPIWRPSSRLEASSRPELSVRC